MSWIVTHAHMSNKTTGADTQERGCRRLCCGSGALQAAEEPKNADPQAAPPRREPEVEKSNVLPACRVKNRCISQPVARRTLRGAPRGPSPACLQGRTQKTAGRRAATHSPGQAMPAIPHAPATQSGLPARLNSRRQAALVRDACLTRSLGQLGGVLAGDLAEDHAHAAGQALQADGVLHVETTTLGSAAHV